MVLKADLAFNNSDYLTTSGWCALVAMFVQIYVCVWVKQWEYKVPGSMQKHSIGKKEFYAVNMQVESLENPFSMHLNNEAQNHSSNDPCQD